MQAQSITKRLLFTLGIALLGAGCAEVISHEGELVVDAGSDVSDATSDVPEAPSGPCSSGRWWLNGEMGSALMTPGLPCIECHKRKTGSPAYSVAGTIYRNIQEADNCNGIEGAGTAVAILEASGNMELTQRIQVNDVGNFVLPASVTLPPMFRAKIVSGMLERVKRDPVSNGDCNLCHTMNGTMGANGRLRKPN